MNLLSTDKLKRFLKNLKPPEHINHEALEELNKTMLNYLASIPKEDLDERVESVVCEEPSSSAEEGVLHSTLKREGIAIVPNFLGDAAAGAAQKEIERIVAGVRIQDPRGTGCEVEGAIVQGEVKLFSSYSEMASHSKPVISIRQGSDQGMVDIFNVDKLLGDEGANLRSIYSKPWLNRLLNSYDEAVVPANLNAYVNEGITRTRGFHVDTYRRSLKGFLYLTDVNSLDDGPYCFVKGSHMESAWRTVNKQIGRSTSKTTEAPIVDPLKITPCLARKGTLVLSDQSGIHRGIPQCPRSSRMLLVMRYL